MSNEQEAIMAEVGEVRREVLALLDRLGELAQSDRFTQMVMLMAVANLQDLPNGPGYATEEQIKCAVNEIGPSIHAQVGLLSNFFAGHMAITGTKDGETVWTLTNEGRKEAERLRPLLAKES